MMKFTIRKSLGILFLIFTLFSSFCLQAWAYSPKTKIIATTSLIACITKEVGKDKVTVTTIIPPASCPGHFDLKIKDIQFLQEANAIFYHGWERFMPKLLEAAPGKKGVSKEIAVTGNWMLPEKQKKAALAIAKELGRLDKKNQSYYLKNALTYNHRIDQEVRTIKEKTTKLKGKTVIVSTLQKDFVLWLGCKVVGSYGRGEDLTPQQIVQLVEKGEKSQVHLIIDNLQSGPGAGKAIANELGVRNITLTNFPGGLPGTANYLQTLEKNTHLILANWK